MKFEVPFLHGHVFINYLIMLLGRSVFKDVN